MGQERAVAGSPRLVAVLVVVAVVSGGLALLLALTGGGDSSDAALPDLGPPQPTTRLDDIFPGRPTPVAGDPTPTADPDAAGDAAVDIVQVAADWALNSFAESDVVVLLENTGEVSYANVSVDLIVLGRDGNEVGHVSAAYARFDATQVVPISTTLPVDAGEIAAVELEVRARGTLPSLSGMTTVVGTQWSQDDIGTVSVTGIVEPVQRIDFVGVVAVLRGLDGAFVGTAVGFLDGVGPEGRAFDAAGFPSETVASVEVYTTA